MPVTTVVDKIKCESCGTVNLKFSDGYITNVHFAMCKKKDVFVIHKFEDIQTYIDSIGDKENG